MAGDKEISEIVKKSKVLLLDIEGTTTSISFVKDKLFPYAEEHVHQFLSDQWESDGVKEVVEGLRKLSLEDKENSVEGAVEIPGEDATKEAQIDGVVKSVKWMMSLDRKAGPLKQLQGLIWERGYDQGDIKGHVFDDVAPALEQWRSVTGQKIYIYSSGSVKAQKLLFGRSLAGDLLKHIDGHFDTAVGAKQEKGSYTKIVEQIGCKAEEILFLTDVEKEAEVAREAGLNAALVVRDGNLLLSNEAETSYPMVYSFNQLTANYKRKQDTQDEQPAKIARTETQEEVKIDIEEAPMETDTKAEKEEEKVESKEETPVVAEETVVEEITDTEVADAAEVDIQPVVIEEKPAEQEKVQDQEMAKEVKTEEVKSTEEVKEDDVKTIITVTEVSDGEKVEEIAMDPIVEEPNVEAEMVELHNVGEELEKECDEILSKVQNVTNLDNITVKPMLDPIREDNFDTENTDTSDLVDNILSTELDMEKKLAESIEKEAQKPTEVTEAPENATEHTNGNTTEVKLNGNAVNGNGDSNDCDRLEEVPQTANGNGNTEANGNGNTEANGNGDTNGKEVGQGDCKEVADIKVKTVGEEVQPEPVKETVEA